MTDDEIKKRVKEAYDLAFSAGADKGKLDAISAILDWVEQKSDEKSRVLNKMGHQNIPILFDNREIITKLRAMTMEVSNKHQPQ